jgi:predicted PurR-regulated permease PerM
MPSEAWEGCVAAALRLHWGRALFYTLVAASAAWLLWAGRGIWLPVGLAFALAVVLDPVVDRLENRGVPRGLATTLIFLLLVGGLAAALFLLSPMLSAQAGAMARDLGRLVPDPAHPDLVPVTRRVLERLDAHPALRDALVEAARTGTQRLSAGLEGVSALALAWAPNLVWFIVVPVIAFYALTDFHRIYAKAMLLVPAIHRPFAQSLVAEVSAVLGKYLRGLVLLCGMLGVSIAAVLWAMGNPYWQLLGLVGGLLYAIPVVGSASTVCLIVLVGLVTTTPGRALVNGGAVLLLSSGLFDQVVTPRVLGRQVGLHPLLTILALLLGYQVAGITGMLVAVPLAATVQTVVVLLIPKLGVDMELRPLTELEQTEEETRGVHLLAEEKPLDQHFYLHSVVEGVEEPADRAA